MKSVTIREILQLDYFKDHRLVAGKEGLDREVRNATIFESSSVQYLPEHTFVSTTASAFSQNPQGLVRWLEDLAANNVSAVAIKTGNYLSSLPDEAISLFDSQKIPLLESPQHSNPAHFTSTVLKPIILLNSTKQSEQIQRDRFFLKACSYPSCDSNDQHLLQMEARSLNCRLDLPYVIISAPTKSDDADGDGLLNELLSFCRARDPYAWGAVTRKRVVTFYHPRHFRVSRAEADNDLRMLVQRMLEDNPGNLFVSDFAEGLKELARTWQDLTFYEAICLHTSGISSNSARFINQPGSMFYISRLYEDRALCQRIVDSRLRWPLEGLPEQRREELIDTLREYLRERGAITRIASKLHTHPNTISYRIKSLEDLLQCDLKNPRIRNDLWIALILYDLQNLPADAFE